MGLRAWWKMLTERDVISTHVRRIDGRGDKDTQRSLFNHQQAVAAFAKWVYVAIGLRVDELQRHQLRLMVRKKAPTNRYGLRTLLWGSQKVPTHRRRYYEGQVKGNEPSSLARVKLASMGPDGYEEVIDHPALSLLRTANDHTIGADLFYLRWAYLYLTGNAYMVPVKNKMEAPSGVWLLPSQWVKIQPDPVEFIKGYVFGTEKQNEQVFAREDVLHQKLPNPQDIYYGMGPTQAAWSALMLHEAKRAEDLAAKENRGHPDYLAIIKSGADSKIIERFEAKWRRMMNRGGDSSKMATITGDVDLKQLNFPPEVLGDPDRVIDEIAGCFRVTRAMLTGNENVPGGAPEISDGGFLRSIAADLKRDEQFLNEKWLPLFGIEDDACLVYDNPLPEDSQFQLEEGTRLVAAGIRTINEERDQRGDAPIEGGDIPRINGTPLDKVGEQQNPFGGLFSIGQPQGQREEGDGAAFSVAALQAMSSVKHGLEKINDRLDKTDQRLAAIADREVEKEAKAAEGVAVPEKQAQGSDDPAPTFLSDEVWRAWDGAQAGDCHAVCRHVDAGDSGDMVDAGSAEADPRWLKYVEGKAPAGDNERDDEQLWPVDAMAGRLEGLLRIMRDRIVGVLRESDASKAPDIADAMFEDNDSWGHINRGDLVLLCTRDIGKDWEWTTNTITKLRNQDLDDIERIIREYEEAIANAVRPFAAEAIKAGALSGLAAINLPASTFEITNPAVEAALREFSENLAGGVASSTVRHIRSSLADGIAQGESVGQLTARVDDTGLFSRSRAEAIARSESARAFVEGEVQGWKQSGVVQGKRWRLAPGACPYCRETARRFNNRTIGLDEPFYEKGSVLQPAGERPMKLDYAAVNGPPLHPNDRCGVEPVLIDN